MNPFQFKFYPSYCPKISILLQGHLKIVYLLTAVHVFRFVFIIEEKQKLKLEAVCGHNMRLYTRLK